MEYSLCLLTSPGRDGCLRRTLASFEERVTPKPKQLLAYCDGPVGLPAMYTNAAWDIATGRRQDGFCKATRNLWVHAAERGCEWLFWLEDDFLFTRSVDLRDLAAVMEAEPQVAQMALLRQPCNADEEAVGGYMQQSPEEYHRRGAGGSFWWEHRHHWTTNPSLLRRDIPASIAWPEGPECEGKFGFRIREQRPDTTFGIWGADSQPWVMHIGDRIGHGY